MVKSVCLDLRRGRGVSGEGEGLCLVTELQTETAREHLAKQERIRRRDESVPE